MSLRQYEDYGEVHANQHIQGIYPAKWTYLAAKRIMDIILGGIILLLTLPLITVVAGLIKLESPGPIIYSQRRLGLEGKVFTIYKLRSMYYKQYEYEQAWTSQNDFRITRVGSFIRKCRIDELPQLLNVLKGDMSLVGPRPEQPKLAEIFTCFLPEFSQRLSVKPGLTGWAQVNGGYDLSVKSKLARDMYYIREKTFWLDMKILFKTLIVLVTFKGAR
ncbi:MAG: sugar transferase [Halanaerobium sp.]|nr:sugar transferase [Halanaerobium sp.]